MLHERALGMVGVLGDEEAQALEIAKTGPLRPNDMEMAVAAALTIVRGTVAGCILGDLSPKNLSYPASSA